MSEGASGLGSADLATLSARAVAAIIGQGDGSAEVRDGAVALVSALEASTRSLAERTHAEFTAAIGWTVEQRQEHSLRAIVERVKATRIILAGAGFGQETEEAITDLLREIYFDQILVAASSVILKNLNSLNAN